MFRHKFGHIRIMSLFILIPTLTFVRSRLFSHQGRRGLTINHLPLKRNIDDVFSLPCDGRELERVNHNAFLHIKITS